MSGCCYRGDCPAIHGATWHFTRGVNAGIQRALPSERKAEVVARARITMNEEVAALGEVEFEGTTYRFKETRVYGIESFVVPLRFAIMYEDAFDDTHYVMQPACDVFLAPLVKITFI